MTMDELKPKQSAYIRSVGGNGALRHHLLDMGLTSRTEVTLQKIAPMGDPVQIELRGYELTLRLDEARKIEIEKVHQKMVKPHAEQWTAAVAHPGVGELGRAKSYHVHVGGNEIPKGMLLFLQSFLSYGLGKAKQMKAAARYRVLSEYSGRFSVGENRVCCVWKLVKY